VGVRCCRAIVSACCARSPVSRVPMAQPITAREFLGLGALGRPCGAVGLGLPMLGGPAIQHVLRNPQVPRHLGHRVSGFTHQLHRLPLKLSGYRRRVHSAMTPSDLSILPLLEVSVKSGEGQPQGLARRPASKASDSLAWLSDERRAWRNGGAIRKDFRPLCFLVTNCNAPSNSTPCQIVAYKLLLSLWGRRQKNSRSM
jgi:hypothetical protein